MNDILTKPSVAILGGTGDLGSGLAACLARAGHKVLIGSRSVERAEQAAREISILAGQLVEGFNNLDAAQAAEISILAVPFQSHDSTLAEVRDALAGKILVDAVVPLVPPRVSVAQPPEEGSAAVIARLILGDAVRVVSAFHNVAAAKLRGGGEVECDVLVFGDDADARKQVIKLAEAIGTRGIDGGPLDNSIAAEALTSVLIGINRRYKTNAAGIRITGIPAAQA